MQPERYETFIKALTDLTRRLRKPRTPTCCRTWRPRPWSRTGSLEKAADEARKKLVGIWAKYKD
jgi:hypothetical protein